MVSTMVVKTEKTEKTEKPEIYYIFPIPWLERLKI